MNVSDVVQSSKFHLNQVVKTPLGAGRYQAPFAVVDAKGEIVTTGLMVQLPINEVTGAALNLSNCLTPSAKLNGLWVFQEGEIS